MIIFIEFIDNGGAPHYPVLGPTGSGAWIPAWNNDLLITPLALFQFLPRPPRTRIFVPFPRLKNRNPDLCHRKFEIFPSIKMEP